MRTLAFFACLGLCFATSGQAAGFTSPSKNIRCYLDIYSGGNIDALDLVCLVFNADWDLPPDYGDDDPTCELDRVRTVILARNAPAVARWTCHGDIFWPAPLGAISYGSQWTIFDYSCDVAQDGVRCENGVGDGFHIRRSALTLE